MEKVTEHICAILSYHLGKHTKNDNNYFIENSQIYDNSVLISWNFLDEDFIVMT